MKDLVFALVLGLLALAGPADAANIQTLTFDDLPYVYGVPEIPNGYGGLNWSSCSSYAGPNGPTFPICTAFGYEDASISLGGYKTAVVSAPNIAYNLAGFYEGSVTSISSSAPFMLLSGYFAAAFYDGLTITVSAAGQTKTFVVGTETPVLETFDFGPVYQIDFSASGGTPNPAIVPALGGDCNGQPCGWYYGMDNLVVESVEAPPAPEPGFNGAVTVCMAGVLFAVRRRRNSNL